MKKILLVYPMSRTADTIEHMGLGYLASYLRREQHTVKLFVYKTVDDPQSFFKLISEYAPDIIGFSTFTESISAIIEISKTIKSLREIQIILGGHAATQQAEQILRENPCIDFIIMGEGEITFSEVAAWSGDTENLKYIDGLVYRDKSGNIRKNPPRQAITDLDTLPFPARDLYIEAKEKPPLALVSTARGCLAHCSFCGYSSCRQAKTPIWRGRSPENIVDELEYLNRDLGIDTFFITDPTFEDPGSVGKARIERIAHGIINRHLDISYEVHMRAENWFEDDNLLLDLLFRSGLESTVVGLESGSEKGLKVYEKRANVRDNMRFVKLMKKAHISLEYGFIMFHPYITFEECRETISFLKEARLAYSIKCILTKLELYPGVSLVDKMISDGLLKKPFSYQNSMFAYRFVHSELENLCDRLCALPQQIPIIDEFDLFITRYRIFLTRCWRRLYFNNKMCGEVQRLQVETDKVLYKLTTDNLDFFEQCLRLAEHDWSETCFEMHVDEYIKQRLPLNMAALKKIQFEFIRNLHKNKIDISELKI